MTLVLITGATRGIGQAAAVQLARAGAELAVVGRDPERVEIVAGEAEAAGGGARVHQHLADLSLARSQARLISKPLTVVFDTAAQRYQISGMEDLFHRTNVYSVQLSEQPYRATLVSVSFGGGAAQVTFDQYGSPNTGGTIVVDSGGSRKTIVLNQASERAVIQ